jgi:ABC-type enterochelin transport system permease subunit
MTSILYGRLITILGVCYENYELLTIPMALIFEVLNLGDGLNMVVQGKTCYQNLSLEYKITKNGIHVFSCNLKNKECNEIQNTLFK